MTSELEQLRQLAEHLRSAWHHGDWKAETPNEEAMEKIMTELGYWPITSDWFWGNKTIGEPNPDDEWVEDGWGNRFKKSLFESFYDQPSTQVYGGEMNMGETTTMTTNNNPGTTTSGTNSTMKQQVQIYINDINAFGEELSDVETDTLYDFAMWVDNIDDFYIS